MAELEMIGALTREQVIRHLQEVRVEITRLNRAAGETRFNPAATQGLEAVLGVLAAIEGAEVIDDILEGKY
jgi:hypothetical protein